MTLEPGLPGRGIVFHRSDLGADIPALFDRVADTRLGTVLRQGKASAGVVEHLMAALAGAGVDDARIVLDGPEPPILDGDSLSYLRLIDAAGMVESEAPREIVRVRKAVMAQSGQARAALYPDDERRFDFEIEFATPVIGAQHYGFVLTPERFRAEIAPARTFGFVSDLAALLQMGLSRGASLQNTLALEGDHLANPELLRFPDEFVRHKILDAIGDLALAGAPIIGRFEGVRSSHALNNALLHALFADAQNYERLNS